MGRVIQRGPFFWYDDSGHWEPFPVMQPKYDKLGQQCSNFDDSASCVLDVIIGCLDRRPGATQKAFPEIPFPPRDP